MVVMINGSFGVGKTTVAASLRQMLPKSVIYDPEWAGFVLKRAPGWITLRGAGSDDYQDLDLWRRSVIAGVRAFRYFASGPVIVPMAFSRRDYFDEVRCGIERFDPLLRVFCLRASLKTIQSRLAARDLGVEGREAQWIARRARECVDAHRDPHFGEPVDTEGRSPFEIAGDIVERLHHER
jgi:hypothetical protein